MVLLLLKVGVVVWRSHGVVVIKQGILNTKRKRKEKRGVEESKSGMEERKGENGGKIYSYEGSTVFWQEEAGNDRMSWTRAGSGGINRREGRRKKNRVGELAQGRYHSPVFCHDSLSLTGPWRPVEVAYCHADPHG